MTTREDYLKEREKTLTKEQVEKERRFLEALDRTIESIILEAEIMTGMEKMWKKQQKGTPNQWQEKAIPPNRSLK